ncbi:MAG: hypothetical protein NTW18_06145 [Candidatus Omnitrophica bacterium]|nr:hypothetical protein [Candidatus Omnitrophota bacterium]
MQGAQVQNLILSLTKKWDIYSSLDLNKITKMLWSSSLGGSSGGLNTFESSLVSSERAIRLLHLNFYKPGLPYNKIRVLRKKRIESIASIISYVNKESGFRFNLNILKDLTSSMDDTSWPVQFGYTLKKNKPPVMKIYLSVISDNAQCGYLMERLCALLGLSWLKLKNNFLDTQFDAIGIDFLHNGCCRLKIYTILRPAFNLSDIPRAYRKYQNSKDIYLGHYLAVIGKIPLRHIGFLYRIDKTSRIESVKIWARLKKPTPFKSLQPIMKPVPARLNSWLISTGAIIEGISAGVSYLTLENKEIGVYFR